MAGGLACFLWAAASGLGAPVFAAPAPAGYHLVHTYRLGGAGFWDYLMLDSAARRLYISRGTHVVVMNVNTGKVIGDIPDGHREHGIALAPELNRGFISDGTDPSHVIVFNLKTLKVVTILAMPNKDSDCIIYDPATQRVFTFNGDDRDATAIDAKTDKVLGTIALGGQPEYAVADGAGHLYNNLVDKSEQVQIDSRSLQVTDRWPLAPCEHPSGLAMDVAHRRLFAGCHSEVMAIVDPDAHRVITTVPIGAGVDANRFDPGTQLAFSSNGMSGNLTVVHEDSPDMFTELGDVRTEAAARTMALDLKTHHVFLVTATMGPRPAKATPENPRRRPTMVPGTFRVLEYAQAGDAR
jgi:DNA-binding beta-propeller fold protein YncE